MKLTFTQNNCESGSVTGDGIGWFWSGQHLEGPEETIEELGSALEAKLEAEWPEIDGDSLFDVPVVAEIEWPGAEVLNVRLNFEFDKEALFGPDETKAEIQEFFSESVEFADTLVSGKNTAKVGGKAFEFQIEA